MHQPDTLAAVLLVVLHALAYVLSLQPAILLEMGPLLWILVFAPSALLALMASRGT